MRRKSKKTFGKWKYYFCEEEEKSRRKGRKACSFGGEEKRIRKRRKLFEKENIFRRLRKMEKGKEKNTGYFFLTEMSLDWPSQHAWAAPPPPP